MPQDLPGRFDPQARLVEVRAPSDGVGVPRVDVVGVHGRGPALGERDDAVGASIVPRRHVADEIALGPASESDRLIEVPAAPLERGLVPIPGSVEPGEESLAAHDALTVSRTTGFGRKTP